MGTQVRSRIAPALSVGAVGLGSTRLRLSRVWLTAKKMANVGSLKLYANRDALLQGDAVAPGETDR
jgi:hypothetical protein